MLDAFCVDNRIEAAEAVIKAENQTGSPVTARIEELMKWLPAPFGKLAQTALQSVMPNRVEQIAYLFLR
jgi:hypothetical protein